MARPSHEQTCQGLVTVAHLVECLEESILWVHFQIKCGDPHSSTRLCSRIQLRCAWFIVPKWQTFDCFLPSSSYFTLLQNFLHISQEYVMQACFPPRILTQMKNLDNTIDKAVTNTAHWAVSCLKLLARLPYVQFDKMLLLHTISSHCYFHISICIYIHINTYR